MNKLRLGVIFGGQSSEYDISLHSAASFLRSLHMDRYEVVMIGIARDGQFYHVDASNDDIEHDHWQNSSHKAAWIHKGLLDLETGQSHPLDVVFPILHGKNGEDGSIQGMMNVLDIPVVGCDVLGSAICMDKEIMHLLVDQAGLEAAPYICLHEDQELPSFEALVEEMPLPWVVKPCSAGSSFGVHFVENKEQFEEALADAFRYDGRHKALVEKAIDGFEIGCAVRSEDGQLITGEIDEIETAGKVFDFEGKYALKESALYCPARISSEMQIQAKEKAKEYFRALQCMDMARVDMFVCKDGSIILNEVNTIPGMTATSRYPSMMEKAGTPFADLIDLLIEEARKKEQVI